ncbi:MAG: YggT family protein [Clostridia bacterium]|nr:YggT family protein [Clostridia bacterium]
MSWFPIDGTNPIVSFLYAVTEPVLEPVRRVLFKIPALQSIPIDFSILVVFLLLSVLRGFI